MRILLDTNILIPLEDSSQVLDDSLGELARLANEHGHQLLCHPASVADFQRDTDATRREINLSRIRRYVPLESPPSPSADDIASLNLTEANDNDRVDNILLFAIHRDAANILVTEDRGLHRKAAHLGLSDRVHYVQQARVFLERLHPSVAISLPNIEEMALHELNLSDSFFDSLRESYNGFDDWFRRSSRNGRKAWVHKDDTGVPAAIAIYKIEDSPIVTSDRRGLSGHVLKLCTFKVGERIRGRKVGELFLKAAFRFARSNGLESIYLTMRPGQQEFLKDLCMDFGFYHYGNCEQEAYTDEVLIKDHPAVPPVCDLTGLEYHKRFFPNICCTSNQGKYIVPIQPRFHRMLFPDIQPILPQLGLFSQNGADSVGNPIKQAYLCHARISGIQAGDILLFYRSDDWKAISTIGVVESSHVPNSTEKIMELVAKRTVYSYSEISEMVQTQTKVILFRTAWHLDRRIPYNWLRDNGVVNGIIQTIRNISDQSFRRIVDEWEISNCIYPD